MPGSEHFTVTLPSQVAELVRAKVATGEYATECDVILEGLNVLLARDDLVEHWLQDEVGPAYDALKADPSRAVSAVDVRATLAAGRGRDTAER